jgi:predicted RNase H-like HicB family nuclease
MKRASNQNRFALCLENAGYPASLERWKIYRFFEDADAATHGQVRVVDESGEDYLFPREYFAPIALRHSKEGYSVSVPDLPGCWSQGRTAREAVGNLQAAVREYVSVAKDLGRGPREC